MSSLTNDPSLYAVLLEIDKGLAAETREKGCPHCGGILHSACYPRKLKESPVPLDGSEIVRFSFCCSTDGCRRRITPPSVRFLGRKRYMGAVVVLLSAMFHGLTQRRAEELEKLVGVSPRTLSRWQTWWQEVFPVSRFWGVQQSFYSAAIGSCSPMSRSCRALFCPIRDGRHGEVVTVSLATELPSPVMEMQAL